MRLKTQRKVVYAAMGLSVLALTGGFALAAGFGLGGSNAAQQASHVTTVGPAVGLAWKSDSLVLLSAAPSSDCGGKLAPCDVATVGADNCAGGISEDACPAGTWAEEVNLTTIVDTAFTGQAGGIANTLNITVYLETSTNTYVGQTFFYTQASGANTLAVITQDFDLGSPLTVTVTSVTVIVQG